MRFREFEPQQGHVKKLIKPWNKDLLEGVFACFERNFPAYSASDLKDSMRYPPEDAFTDIYVIIAGEQGLTEDQTTPDMIRGFYILRAGNLIREFDPRQYPQVMSWRGRGLEGIALALDQEYRGTGVGRELINVPYTLNYDYIWGMQAAHLQNLAHWLKRRQLVMTVDDSDESESYHVTAAVLK